MIEEKINFTSVIFENVDDSNLESIRKELTNAIQYFEEKYQCICCSVVSKIEVNSEKLMKGNRLKINGKFNFVTRVLSLKSEISNLNKYRNTIIHELCHARFNSEALLKNNWISGKQRIDDPVIYLINEYMACKNSAKYSYDLEEVKKFYEYQDSYLYNKKLKSNKEMATLISMIIVSEEIIRMNGERTKGIYISEIKNIKNELEKIDFIPNLEQYENLKKLLLKYNFKC